MSGRPPRRVAALSDVIGPEVFSCLIGFAIQKISIKQDCSRQTASAPYRTWYDLTLGDYRPSLTTILTKQQAIVNPVYNPVPPYTPAAVSTYIMHLFDGVLSDPSGVVQHFETIIDISNTSGNLQFVSLQLNKGSLGNIDVNYDTGGKYYIVDGAGNPAEEKRKIGFAK